MTKPTALPPRFGDLTRYVSWVVSPGTAEYVPDPLPPATLVIVSSFALAPPSARPPCRFQAVVFGPYLVFHLRCIILLGYRLLSGLRCSDPGIGSLRRSVGVPWWAARPRWFARGRVSSGSLTAALGFPPFVCYGLTTNEEIVWWRRPPIFVAAVVGQGIVRACRRGALGLRRSRGGHDCLGGI